MSQIVLSALKKELKTLTRKAEKAKQEVDENINVGTEKIAIYKETMAIINSGETGQHIIDKLDVLKRREKRVNQVLKKDLIKLMDKQHEADMQVYELQREISRMEFRLSHRRSEEDE